jgi:hypothetical protein
MPGIFMPDMPPDMSAVCAPPLRAGNAPLRPLNAADNSRLRLFIRLALSVAALENIYDFGDLPALILFVAAADRMFDAMAHMIAQDFLLRPPQRRPHRRNLRDDVDAVAALFHHAGQAAHLAFNAVEAFPDSGLGVVLHN